MLVEQNIVLNSNTAKINSIISFSWKSKFSNSEIQIYLDQSNRIVVTFPYNEEYIQKLKKFPGHRWHPNLKQWSFPYSEENIKKIIKIFDENKINISPELQRRLNIKGQQNELPKTNQEVIADLTEMRKLMRLKNYSHKTIKAYVSCVRTLFRFFENRNPRDLSCEEIRTFLLHLMDIEEFSAASVNQTINAIRFYYVEYLKKPFAVGDIPRPRNEKKLPVVLDKEEVKSIFDAVPNLKHKALLMITYSGGLRVGEVVRLQLQDIDSKRMTIHVHKAKGLKDRYTILGKKALEVLREYYIRLIVCDYMRKRIYNTNKRSSSINPK